MLGALTCAGTAQGAALSESPRPSAESKHESSRGYSLKASKTKPYTPCPSSKKKEIAKCGVIIEPKPVKKGSRWALPEGGPLLKGSGVEGGWSPADLQSAYSIPTSGGETQTVAVVLAYGDETAESDLAEYRKQYGLGSCTKSNGCFKKVNQSGEEKNYPEPGPAGWAVETALDLEMVSAACPECNILLVEANTASIADLAAAVETAAKLGATEISNSYGAPERYSPLCPKDKGCSEYLPAYNHPGIPVTVSAGDSSFDEEYYIEYGNAISGGPSWPAASPDVIAVGGTELEKAENARGWTEKVWAFSGSGCSLVESKPSWQSDPNCSKRMGNDIAAVASSVSMYSTPGLGGWANVGGTSVSAPLIAGIEAHASKAVREEGAEAFYRRKLNDVTVGINGTCRHEYPCEAGEGYDGPTGWGTPNGPFEETATFAATTGEVSNRAADGAKLIGAVYPQGAETIYYFEYGPTTAYGMSTKSESAGSGTLWKSVSQTVSGLPEGTYHYRLAAVRESKTTYGSDQTFQTSPWSVQTTSNEGEGLNPLTSISCTSTTTCMAVGWHTYFYGEEHHGWSHRWDGSKWTSQKTASVENSSLNSVSCTASNACTAVGKKWNTEVPHAERWNGSAWSAQTVPAPKVELAGEEISLGTELTSVSCTSSTSCVAVGWYRYDYDEEQILPFSAVWDGTTWQLKTVPTPSGAVFGSLNEISCTSATSCIAVGTYYTEYKAGITEYRSLSETWNGTEWTIQSMPKPEDSETTLYWLGLSCLSASNCIAVGSYEKSSDKYRFHALGARWDGSSWTLQSMPAQPEKDELHLEDVSCSTTTTCLAVGFAYRSTPLGYKLRSLGMNWNGAKWSVQEMAPVTYNSVGMERPSDLLGVSCVSLSCETVGEMGNFGWSWSLAMGSMQTAPGAPKATTEVASSTGTTEPVLNASVNANGYDTSYYFEYDTKEYKTGEGPHGSSVPVPAKEIGSYAWDQHVSEKIKGLKQKTTYHFRIVAENGLGVTRGSDQSFTTISAKASTEAATLVTAGEATLKGTVNPEGVETSYQFEYGTTISYGQLAPAEAKSAGKGIIDVKVSQIVSGLKPATTYHFRLAASNADIGTIYGSDQTFTTGAKLHWFACTKQTGGRYTNSKCATDGAPNEWESLHLKEAEKTSIKAIGNPLAITASIGGVKGTLNCETEVTNASLENPSGGGVGLGSAELKFKGCKAESGWSTCKVTPGSAVAEKLELSTSEGKAYALLTPKSGETLGSFTFAECGGLSGTRNLTGTLRGLYSNANSKIEFSSETEGNLLKLSGNKATPVGSIGLETSAGGYVRAE
jgi:hypothetical protein